MNYASEDGEYMEDELSSTRERVRIKSRSSSRRKKNGRDPGRYYSREMYEDAL